MKILRIDCSAQTETGQSRHLADRIIDRLTDTGKPFDVTVRDLNNPLPLLDHAWINANSTPEEDRTDQQKDVLALSDTLIAEIDAADTLIIGAPVYNFSIPASLKLWIDLICRARKTFAYSDTGPKGLLSGKTAIVCFASGGTDFGSDIDFASGYLRHILGFVGITDVTFVAANRHFMDDTAIARAEGEVDAWVDQLGLPKDDRLRPATKAGVN
ncbi:NAD(P)H-dependent oxidoreductase [uncultured Litoreibacter sp.]|uniref:FMN-dependent NADH-azoreductase n=1 Tax=uncultured Litoreibacter sp. TaxID=1392394 RepID=UPI00260E3C47|nr:NAD(P)H-dependent oxidoreductase [uncultured Litoreibacter sp.]